jgi:hypothetical protein
MSPLIKAMKWPFTIEEKYPAVSKWVGVVWFAFLLYVGYSITFAASAHASIFFLGYKEPNCEGDVYPAREFEDLLEIDAVSYALSTSPDYCRLAPSSAMVTVTGIGHALTITVVGGTVSIIRQSVAAVATAIGGWFGWEMATGNSLSAAYRANVVVPHAETLTNDPCLILLSGPVGPAAMHAYAECRRRMSP